jgi:ketosteroid isomerase-like protein
MPQPLALIVILGIGASALSIANQPNPDAELLAANRRYDTALVTADAAALTAIYRPDFVYIGPEGVVRDKPTQIAALVSGTVDLLEGRSDSVAVRRYGDSAILTGRFTGRVRTPDGEYAFREIYSTTWVRRAGAWQLALEHGTVIRTPH